MVKDYDNKSRVNLANNIKRLRYENKWSQEKLAELSNSSANYISNVESGNRNPSLDFIDSIAKAFGINSIDLLTDSKEIKSKLRVDCKED